MNLSNPAPSLESQKKPKKDYLVTPSILNHEVSKLAMMRSWGEDIDSRELYIVNSCIEWTRAMPEKDGSEGVRLNHAIHPYLAKSIEADELEFSVAPINMANPELTDVDQILKQAAQTFLNGAAKKKNHRCLVLAIPDLDGSKLFAAVDPGRSIKNELLQMGVMTGEYYKSCPFETTFDPATYAHYSPASIVVLRDFTKTDWEFIWRIEEWAESYRAKFGNPSKKIQQGNTPAPVIAKSKPELSKAQSHHQPAAEEPEVTLEICETLSSLDRIREDWQALTPDDCRVFQTFDWNKTWYDKCLNDLNNIMVFCLKGRDRIRAILPCYVDGRGIRLAGDDLCGTQEVIAGNLEDATEIVQMAVGWMSENVPKSHLHFINCHPTGFLQRIIERHKIPAKAASNSSRFLTNHNFVSINGGFDEYTERLMVSKRKHIRESVEALSSDEREFSFQVKREGEIEPEDIEENVRFIASLLCLECSVEPDIVIEFLKGLAQCPDINFQLAQLFVDGERIATEIGFAKHETYFSWLCGSDPKFAADEPSKCLLACRMDEMYERDGVHTLDLMAGESTLESCYTAGQTIAINSHRVFPHKNRMQLGSNWLAEKAKILYGNKEASES